MKKYFVLIFIFFNYSVFSQTDSLNNRNHFPIKISKPSIKNINSYLNFEKKLILKSYNEQKFNAEPRLKKICNFCEYKNVCEKQ